MELADVFDDEDFWYEKSKKFQPYIEKLEKTIKKYGIDYFEYDNHLNNVMFQKENEKLYIAYRIFYRFSGLYSIKKEIKEGFSDFYPVDDDMFYNSYMKSIIFKYFKIEE